MIIGLVGPIACGKGVVADYLIKTYGYTSFSLSSIIHEEVKKRGITDFTRTTLQDIGDELRKKEGEGVLAKRAIKTLYPKPYTLNPNVIIEGIRNPGEIEFLRTIPGFFLIAVDAPIEMRFKRVLERAKPWDPTDWNTFLQIDGRDKGDTQNTSGQQVRKCMEMADVKIINEGNINQVREQVEKVLNEKMNK